MDVSFIYLFFSVFPFQFKTKQLTSPVTVYMFLWLPSNHAIAFGELSRCIFQNAYQMRSGDIIIPFLQILEISPWAYLANKIFSSEISPWAYARIKFFFVLWNEIKDSFLVGIKICKYFKVLNLLVIKFFTISKMKI